MRRVTPPPLLSAVRFRAGQRQTIVVLPRRPHRLFPAALSNLFLQTANKLPTLWCTPEVISTMFIYLLICFAGTAAGVSWGQ